MPTKSIEEILIQTGKISTRDLDRALAARGELGGQLDRVLVQLGLVSELDALHAVAQSMGIGTISAADFPPQSLPVQGVEPGFLQSKNAFALAIEDGVLVVATSEPHDTFTSKALTVASGLQVRVLACLPGDLQKAWQQANHAQTLEPDAADDADPFGGDSGEFVEHLKDLASEAPVIRLVTNLIGQVVELRASDIHLEPFDDGLRTRYRRDGVLVPGETVPIQLGAAVVSRVKLLAHLDIAERRLPQDGRIKTRVQGRELDLRVSTVPTVYGESVVMRVLDRANVRFSMEEMGFSQGNLTQLNQLLARPHGVLLVTGPTGSGKTTTLYAALSKLDTTSQKVITVEDPVEYQIEGINQIQVHPQINLTFANALRSILRQDPDIIMVGEMRDGETAQIAVQSALTGHLVLSTLHTNTAAGAVVRMRDMGVPSYLITSALNGVVAQRLVRLLCPVCKTPDALTPQYRTSIGLAKYASEAHPVYKPVGCPQCRGTGYAGRTGIHEVFVLDAALRQAIMEEVDANALHHLARERGMQTVFEDGLRKVAAGLTSLDEVIRVTQDQTDA